MASYYEGFIKAVSNKSKDSELINTMKKHDEYNVAVKKKLFSNMSIKLKQVIKDNQVVSPVSKLSFSMSKIESAFDTTE